ncbi:hypothetical protein [Mycolicibacterium septicum]|jgi:hypothetical protein|uniref:Uncharacterized protein n=1 Tax=Mycolicibacterium septicum DSM 44393 TaxID=1341646 RepID=A0A7X6RY73_9MYCO|nr:hypothetical protein [Mycolicibacterium septicum]NKZ13401.1 hypothetical protein [Mycolicibacterium septicum DSM 44393]QRY54147.1 hypothetical protein JVX95_13020 [Mycolicibacterium septicum]
MADLNPQPLPPRDRIRISAPDSVLFDLKKFQKAQASVLGHAGCPGCHSGLDLHWQGFSDFVINEEGVATPTTG